MDEEKKKFQGNWKCSGCGAAITELPFQPDPAREGELTCFDCHKQKMANRPRRDNSERRMFKGNWKCGKCGGAISELPFQPNPQGLERLMCIDCFKKSK